MVRGYEHLLLTNNVAAASIYGRFPTLQLYTRSLVYSDCGPSKKHSFLFFFETLARIRTDLLYSFSSLVSMCSSFIGKPNRVAGLLVETKKWVACKKTTNRIVGASSQIDRMRMRTAGKRIGEVCRLADSSASGRSLITATVAVLHNTADHRQLQTTAATHEGWNKNTKEKTTEKKSARQKQARTFREGNAKDQRTK